MRAWDQLVLAWIADGDLEAAAGSLARAYHGLGPIADERTSYGRRVQRALARMRSVARLADAVRERRDARTVERR